MRSKEMENDQALLRIGGRDEADEDMVQFDLESIMAGIALCLEKDALGDGKSIEFTVNFGEQLFQAYFVTEVIGSKSNKKIGLRELFDNGVRQELFNMNVVESEGFGYDIRRGVIYHGGPTPDSHELSHRDKALLQHVYGILLSRKK